MLTTYKQLLLVEDDDAIREGYTEMLSDAGFQVVAFADRATALEHCQATLPDLAILDVTLHGERDAGFELCKSLRELSSTLPIIFLTAHDGDFNRISGLRLGADDYLVKSVSLDYLIVRIETLLRRAEAWQRQTQHEPQPAERIVLSDLTLIPEQLKVFWQDQPVAINLTQFWMLRALVDNPGQVKTFAELMAAANVVVEINTVTSHIKHIRDRFLQIDDRFDRIKSERGRGYRWVVD